ncbi:ABC transporter substrate-binding protein [Pseudobacteriovorax antillogorgiicola]|uniref:Iron complex transport system substrate-binding protein n=1 Tax=Pseudobacteriovorax antillogorgiicola TaxID=1513793 RepID=A0A1Y6BCZ9_9BACT|nr:ABC transporter substrate-binding protein [Pseudobacteriovorax antillogorgiicola]TCS56469.1 iron complex transport system substrate-binding protein [Pseudobacteriovorax antillogorgiicola]SMF05105.1 iron complex transport system substrate-binding protein [Pseudobacteriovorax antillogorgiicola]
MAVLKLYWNLLCCVLGLSLFSAKVHAAPQKLTDSRGHEIKTSVKPPRVVSGFVGADEILVHLLKDRPKSILALSPLSRDPRYSAIYKEAKAWPHQFGDELESLLKMTPDLVIVASYTRAEWLRILDVAKVPYFVLGSFASISDIQGNIEIMGKLVHEEARAKALIESMDQTILTLKNSCKLKGKRIVNYSKDGTIFGAGTSFDSMIAKIGAINAGTQQGVKGWSRVSRESLLVMNPDFIVVGADPDRKSEFLDEMKRQVGWQHLAAVREGRLLMVPSRYLASVSHHITKAMEILCAI